MHQLVFLSIVERDFSQLSVNHIENPTGLDLLGFDNRTRGHRGVFYLRLVISLLLLQLRMSVHRLTQQYQVRFGFCSWRLQFFFWRFLRLTYHHFFLVVLMASLTTGKVASSLEARLYRHVHPMRIVLDIHDCPDFFLMVDLFELNEYYMIVLD